MAIRQPRDSFDWLDIGADGTRNLPSQRGPSDPVGQAFMAIDTGPKSPEQLAAQPPRLSAMAQTPVTFTSANPIPYSGPSVTAPPVFQQAKRENGPSAVPQPAKPAPQWTDASISQPKPNILKDQMIPAAQPSQNWLSGVAGADPTANPILPSAASTPRIQPAPAAPPPPSASKPQGAAPVVIDGVTYQRVFQPGETAHDTATNTAPIQGALTQSGAAESARRLPAAIPPTPAERASGMADASSRRPAALREAGILPPAPTQLRTEGTATLADGSTVGVDDLLRRGARERAQEQADATGRPVVVADPTIGVGGPRNANQGPLNSNRTFLPGNRDNKGAVEGRMNATDSQIRDYRARIAPSFSTIDGQIAAKQQRLTVPGVDKAAVGNEIQALQDQRNTIINGMSSQDKALFDAVNGGVAKTARSAPAEGESQGAFYDRVLRNNQGSSQTFKPKPQPGAAPDPLMGLTPNLLDRRMVGTRKQKPMTPEQADAAMASMIDRVVNRGEKGWMSTKLWRENIEPEIKAAERDYRDAAISQKALQDEREQKLKMWKEVDDKLATHAWEPNPDGNIKDGRYFTQFEKGGTKNYIDAKDHQALLDERAAIQKRISEIGVPNLSGPGYKSGAMIDAEKNVAGAHDKLRSWQNGVRPAAQSGSSEMPKIASDEDYNKLPKGAAYIGPDGKPRRKL